MAAGPQRAFARMRRPLEKLISTRAGARFALEVANPIDRRLLRLTRGRIGLFVGRPVGLLETVGRKSGQPRETPLLYLEDGERIVLVASSGGAPRHPAWFLNLRGNADVHFTARRGGRRAMCARVAEGDERERLWARVNALYTGYETYQERAGRRRIPLVVLEPR